jgi:hypothetical protein
MEKFEWLHQELLKRQIPEKFRPVILVRKGSHQEAPWWDTMETTVKSGLVKPHVGRWPDKEGREVKNVSTSISLTTNAP